ncbi:MAG: hypothetical protein ACJA00_002376 [Myxococcota bacterium]|jgi:hypothetical protein
MPGTADKSLEAIRSDFARMSGRWMSRATLKGPPSGHELGTTSAVAGAHRPRTRDHPGHELGTTLFRQFVRS